MQGQFNKKRPMLSDLKYVESRLKSISHLPLHLWGKDVPSFNVGPSFTRMARPGSGAAVLLGKPALRPFIKLTTPSSRGFIGHRLFESVSNLQHTLSHQTREELAESKRSVFFLRLQASERNTLICT